MASFNLTVEIGTGRYSADPEVQIKEALRQVLEETIDPAWYVSAGTVNNDSDNTYSYKFSGNLLFKQRVILDITYNADDSICPSDWDWDCLTDTYGNVEVIFSECGDPQFVEFMD